MRAHHDRDACGPMLTVRVGEADRPAARRFLESCGAALAGPDPGEDAFAVVALAEEGRPWVAVALLGAAGGGGERRLLALGVAPDRRGAGHGARLLAAVADALRAEGVDRLVATDPPQGPGAWLVRQGFAPAAGVYALDL